MDANESKSDDLNDLEQRLSAWRPSPQGLHPDAMLFAAGRASVRRGNVWLVWPVISACLAILAVALGARLTAERSERLALLREIRDQTAKPASATTPNLDDSPMTNPTASNSYLVLRRMWERSPAEGVTEPITPSAPTKHPPSDEPPILRAWPLAGPLDSL
jgi:hypothetical protein